MWQISRIGVFINLYYNKSDRYISKFYWGQFIGNTFIPDSNEYAPHIVLLLLYYIGKYDKNGGRYG